MALIVEDGSVVANAESYGSDADASAYHTARGNTAWSAADSGDREVALREATAWLDSQFKLYWQGYRVEHDQSLDWPRYSVVTPDGWTVGSDEIPRDLKHATFEAALRALSGELDPDLNRGGQVLEQRLGPLGVKFADDAPVGTKYQRIENLISWMLQSQGKAQVKLVRS